MKEGMYKVEKIDVGFLEVEKVRSVKMPRARFVEIVEETLDDGNYTTVVRDELMPVAQTMLRFPIGSWIDPNRGCGCVVGEWLVATSELKRAAVAQMFEGSRHDQLASVEHLLAENPHGAELQNFGGDIDVAISREIVSRGVEDDDMDTSWIDEDSVNTYVDSVEIVDEEVDHG
jgi:hypothetical protein